MIDQVCLRLPERFPSVEVNAHVIMPNHIHGIVTLTTCEDGYISDDSPSLSDIVHWFKRHTIQGYAEGVRTGGWPRYQDRLWQRGFMDHVIRNEREMDRLLRYIETNVVLWEDDTFHPRRAP
jgi:REP element-mobilizing transposase RayT